MCLLGNVLDFVAEFDQGIFPSVASSSIYIRMASYSPPKTYDGKDVICACPRLLNESIVIVPIFMFSSSSFMSTMVVDRPGHYDDHSFQVI